VRDEGESDPPRNIAKSVDRSLAHSLTRSLSFPIHGRYILLCPSKVPPPHFLRECRKQPEPTPRSRIPVPASTKTALVLVQLQLTPHDCGDIKPRVVAHGATATTMAHHKHTPTALSKSNATRKESLVTDNPRLVTPTAETPTAETPPLERSLTRTLQLQLQL
jgi:hypothetical protein